MRALFKAIGLAGILTALAAGAAQAEIISYSWHQTSASIPGLRYQGNYVIDTSLPAPDTSSSSDPTNLGGLIWLSISGPDQELSLEDLHPGCNEIPDCYGRYLEWFLSISGPSILLFYTSEYFDFRVFDTELYSDADGGHCYNTGMCRAEGYWANDAPEPATLTMLLGGLCLIGAGQRRRMRFAAI